MTAITALPASALLCFDLNTATAIVAVTAGGITNEAQVTFTNSLSVVKLCKIAGGGLVLTSAVKVCVLPLIASAIRICSTFRELLTRDEV